MLFKEILELVQVNLRERKAHSCQRIRDLFQLQRPLVRRPPPNAVLGVLVNKLDQKQTLWLPEEVHHHPADPADPADPPS